MSILDSALQYQRYGLSIIPTLPGKKPACQWKPYTTTPATADQARAWWTPDHDYGIAVICGKASGNLTMIEVEGRALPRITDLKQTFTNSGHADLWETINAGWVEASPSGGLHWFIRTTVPPAGNQKLAMGSDKQVLAETRAEGGYVIVSPTPANHHSTSRAWTRITGGPGTIPLLDGKEFEQLLDLFRTLDETPTTATQTTSPLSTPKPAAPSRPSDGRRRPGDQFNEEADWSQILVGWQIHHRDADGTLNWTRPGKNLAEGVSATTGHSTDGIDRLYVFSTSTEFPTEVSLTKFKAYSILNHGGDDAAAAKTLAAEGWGDKLEDIIIDLPRVTSRPALQVIQGNDPNPDPKPLTDGSSALAPVLQIRHSGDLTEAAAGKYLADAYHDQAHYIIDSDRWIVWNGHTWQPAGKKQVQVKQLAIEAIGALPVHTKEEAAYRKKLLGNNGVNAALSLMSTDPRVSIGQSVLDKHHGELNTPGGIINLHTGVLLPSDPAKLHTRSTLCAPQDLPTPKWDQFLDETFTGHPGVTRYVQQLAGYSATGYVRAQILPFLYGAGANGKSVLAEVLQRLLKDYAEPAPTNFLMTQQQQHPTEIARLQGARLVIASEVSEGSRFDEAKVKQLTGGDSLTARYMHGDFFTFQPTHKLWLLGNHQPKVSAGGYSFWRRLRQIPFTNIVPEDKRVEDLADKLVEDEGAGILNWIIQGAVQYLSGGLTEPSEVLIATKAYEESEDHLRRFVDDRINLGGGDIVRVPYKEMRGTYADWCRLEGIKPATANAFTREVELRFGIGTIRSNGVRYYTNCTIFADADTPENEDRIDAFSDLGGGMKW